MVRSDLFQAMDSVLRDTLRVDLPFGGKQIIVVGDFCQLPPVVDNYELRDYLWNKLGGVFAFQTRAWYDANFETVMLEPTHNQRFKILIEQFMPKWKFYRDELNRLPISHQNWKY